MIGTCKGTWDSFGPKKDKQIVLPLIAQRGNFKIFYVTQILLDITLANVEVKNLPFLEALNLIIWLISAFKYCKKITNIKIRASKCVKLTDFENLDSLILISSIKSE